MNDGKWFHDIAKWGRGEREVFYLPKYLHDLLHFNTFVLTKKCQNDCVCHLNAHTHERIFRLKPRDNNLLASIIYFAVLFFTFWMFKQCKFSDVSMCVLNFTIEWSFCLFVVLPANVCFDVKIDSNSDTLMDSGEAKNFW